MTDKFPERLEFYKDAIARWIPPTASVLIVGGAGNDFTVFKALGFEDVTLSNLDDDVRGSDYAPFKEACEDAENLSFDDGSFDYCVICAALHHCYSPHRALLEMLRVARVGVIFIESRDSWLMRRLENWGFTQTYEYSAVWKSGGLSGGVRNSEIPNYIYRWTEREIEKTARCALPWGEPVFDYRYGNSYPRSTRIMKGAGWKSWIITAARPLYALFARLFKRQQNMFAVYIQKPVAATAFSWIRFEGTTPKFNGAWAAKRLRG